MKHRHFEPFEFGPGGDLRHDVLYGAFVAPATCVTVAGRVFTRPAPGGTARLAGTVATGEEAERFIARLLAIGFTEVK